MKRWLPALLVVVLCVAAWTFFHAPVTEEAVYQPLLYQVTDADGDRVWLFGSIHVGDESMYPFPDYVMSAFDEADALAVECDVLNGASAEVSAQMIDIVNAEKYTDGITIESVIGKDLYKRAKAVLEENYAYTSSLDTHPPITWTLLLEEIMATKSPYDSTLGVDIQLLTKATEEGKPILQIESILGQYTMLYSMSEEIQLMMLEGTLASLEDPSGLASLDVLMNTWKSGNEAAMIELLASEDEALSDEELVIYEEYNRIMVTDRNVLMTDFAEQALVDGQEVFICVGAAHVVGENAMADLLTERGYTVEIISHN